MVFTDDEGVLHTVKGTIRGIRRSLKDGLLGDAENVRIARTKMGPFESLKSYPEFRDLVVQPAKLTGTGSDPTVKKPTANIPTDNVIDVSASPSDSAILTTTTLFPDSTQTKPKTASEQGPCFHLKTTDSSMHAEVWKWIIMGLMFAGAGVLASFLLPFIRHIRWF
jgi:hypothetical protein